MQYFKFFIDLLVMIYKSCNVDFFNLGFGFMDFILGSILLVLIIQFFKNDFGSFSSGSLTSSSFELMKDSYKMNNDDREVIVVRDNKKKEKE